MKKIIQFIPIFILFLTLACGMLPQLTFAQGNIPLDDKVKTPVCGQNDVNLPGCKNPQVRNFSSPQANWFTSDLIPNIITNLIAFIGIASVAMIIYGGVEYLISMGNDDKPKKANKIMTYAVTGLIISMLSYIIVQIVINLNFR